MNQLGSGKCKCRVLTKKEGNVMKVLNVLMAMLNCFIVVVPRFRVSRSEVEGWRFKIGCLDVWNFSGSIRRARPHVERHS
jgi:hypothetical protein